MEPRLDPVIHQQTRLQILGALYRYRRLTYLRLRDSLGLTDGNLAAHVARLEQAGYIRSSRALKDLTFVVIYEITEHGLQAFKVYLGVLQEYLASLE
jgi:DNA-binding MarR family transcriptional regulator